MPYCLVQGKLSQPLKDSRLLFNGIQVIYLLVIIDKRIGHQINGQHFGQLNSNQPRRCS